MVDGMDVRHETCKLVTMSHSHPLRQNTFQILERFESSEELKSGFTLPQEETEKKKERRRRDMNNSLGVREGKETMVSSNLELALSLSLSYFLSFCIFSYLLSLLFSSYLRAILSLSLRVTFLLCVSNLGVNLHSKKMKGRRTFFSSVSLTTFPSNTIFC